MHRLQKPADELLVVFAENVINVAANELQSRKSNNCVQSQDVDQSGEPGPCLALRPFGRPGHGAYVPVARFGRHTGNRTQARRKSFEIMVQSSTKSADTGLKK